MVAGDHCQSRARQGVAGIDADDGDINMMYLTDSGRGLKSPRMMAGGKAG